MANSGPNRSQPQLFGQAALPDAGLAAEQAEAPPAGEGVFEAGTQLDELWLAADAGEIADAIGAVA